MADFYCYLYHRQDGTPYYVGKGTRDRAFQSDGHTVHRPRDRSRITVIPLPAEWVAFAVEKDLIRYFGRKDVGTGILRNMTDGGEGQSGRTYSEQTRARMSAAKKGKPSGRKGKAGHVAWNKGKVGLLSHTEDTRNRISERMKVVMLGNTHGNGNRGRTFSLETRAKMSAAKKGRKLPWVSEANRRRTGTYYGT